MYCMLTAARVVACVTAVQRRVCKPICKKEEREKNAERQRRDTKEAEAAQARAETKRAEAEAKKAEADTQAAEAEESAKRRGHEVRPAWGLQCQMYCDAQAWVRLQPWAALEASLDMLKRVSIRPRPVKALQ